MANLKLRRVGKMFESEVPWNIGNALFCDMFCEQRIRETVERGNVPLVVSNCRLFVG